MGIENDFGSSEFNFEDIFGQTPEEVAQELVDFTANQIRLDKYIAKLKEGNPDVKGWAATIGKEFQTYDNYDEMFADLESRNVDLKRVNVLKIDQPTLIL